MNIEEKIKFAKKFYDNHNLKNYSLKVKRDDDINADYIFIVNSRGPGGLIISDDGEYLFCQSAHDYAFWKEEFKKGIRSHSKKL